MAGQRRLLIIRLMNREATARSNRDIVTVSAAIFALAVGVAVYLTDRGGDAWFVPEPLASDLNRWTIFGAAGGSLPTLVHTAAFAVLIAIALDLRRNGALLVCLAWMFVEVLLELLQIGAIGARIAGALPQAMLVDPIAGYLRSGTFSLGDLGAAALGGVIAAAALIPRWHRCAE